jgi:CheY-like chemotaxis protein
MATDQDGIYQLSESLRLEFVDDFRDRLEKMRVCLRDVQEGTLDPNSGFQEFKRELHNIKGTGASFGFPNLSVLCHRFEECLLNLTDVTFGASRAILMYLEHMTEIADTAEDLDTVKFRALLRSLPLIGARVEDGEREPDGLAPEVLVVAASGTIRHKIRSNLWRFGFHVTTVPDGIVALSLILRGQPDIVIVSGTVENMPGFDLIRAVVSMKSTNDICVAALTSFDLDSPEIKTLPEGVPVIQLGVNMDDQIAKAFSDLEYRFL